MLFRVIEVFPTDKKEKRGKEGRKREKAGGGRLFISCIACAGVGMKLPASPCCHAAMFFSLVLGFLICPLSSFHLLEFSFIYLLYCFGLYYCT